MHASHPRRSRLFVLSILALALALGACGRSADPVSPDRERVSASRAAVAGDGAPGAAASEGSFYPLHVGNHWSYDHALALYLVPPDGPPGPVFGQRDRRDRDLVCVEPLAGRSYTIEQNGVPATPPWWVRYRQDGAGLYEADLSVAQPPACAVATGGRTFDAGASPARREGQAWTALAATLADPAKRAAFRAAWERIERRAAAIRRLSGAASPALPGAPGGVEPGEITRLEYPLRPGARWVIRESPSFEFVVEAAEVLDLPPGKLPAWRIRLESEFLGPSDQVLFWYGRSGFLKSAAHFEGVATDPGGNPIGTLIADETEDLIELSLNRGRFTAR